MNGVNVQSHGDTIDGQLLLGIIRLYLPERLWTLVCHLLVTLFTAGTGIDTFSFLCSSGFKQSDTKVIECTTVVTRDSPRKVSARKKSKVGLSRKRISEID